MCVTSRANILGMVCPFHILSFPASWVWRTTKSWGIEDIQDRQILGL